MAAVETIRTQAQAPMALTSESFDAVKPIARSYMVHITLGLHARPAAMLVNLTNFFFKDHPEVRVQFQKGDCCVSAQSVYGMTYLGAGPGATLEVLVAGASQERAHEYLACVEKILSCREPEVYVHKRNAAELLGLSEEIAASLRRSFFQI